MSWYARIIETNMVLRVNEAPSNMDISDSQRQRQVNIVTQLDGVDRSRHACIRRKVLQKS